MRLLDRCRHVERETDARHATHRRLDRGVGKHVRLRHPIQRSVDDAERPCRVAGGPAAAARPVALDVRVPAEDERLVEREPVLHVAAQRRCHVGGEQGKLLWQRGVVLPAAALNGPRRERVVEESQHHAHAPRAHHAQHLAVAGQRARVLHAGAHAVCQAGASLLHSHCRAAGPAARREAGRPRSKPRPVDRRAVDVHGQAMGEIKVDLRP